MWIHLFVQSDSGSESWDLVAATRKTKTVMVSRSNRGGGRGMVVIYYG